LAIPDAPPNTIAFLPAISIFRSYQATRPCCRNESHKNAVPRDKRVTRLFARHAVSADRIS
jgi:hypothetical protein